MFGLKNNPLSGTIFTDGIIAAVSRNGKSSLVVDFEDYAGAKLRLHFSEVIHFLVGELPERVERASCSRSNEQWLARFTDDDEYTVLEVAFAEMSIDLSQ